MNIFKTTLITLSLFTAFSVHAQTNETFNDTDWRVISFLMGNGIVSDQYTEKMTVNFNQGRVSGLAVCNNFNGTYRLNAKKQIRISPLSSSMAHCGSEEAMNEEVAFMKAWNGITSYQIQGNIMTLKDKAGRTRVQLSATE